MARPAPSYHTRRRDTRHARRNGAAMSGTMANWPASMVSQAVSERERRRVSDRAMDLYVNDAMAHGVLEGLVVESVGTGMTPSFMPEAEWLGKNDEWAADYVGKAQRLYEEWGLDYRRWADAQRRLNMPGLQALMRFSWALDGVGVAQVVARTDAMRPLSLALLPLDPWRLVTPTDIKADIFDGIQVDKDGAPVAAWFRKPGVTTLSPNSGQCTRVDIWDERTGLPRLLLVCDVRNIAEYRQDSILGPVIKEIRDSQDLVDATLVAAVIRNLFVMFLQDGNIGNSKTLTDAERLLEMDKGIVVKGAAKEIPHFFNHTQSTSGYAEIFEGIVNRLGMATGRGGENILRRFQASYSASRANMERSGQVDDYERGVLTTQFNAPAMGWMLYEGCLRGRLPLSADEFRSNVYAATCCDFLPQPFRHIDREKAAKATDLELSNNTNTMSNVAGQMGWDWRQMIDQRCRELQYAKRRAEEYGVDLHMPGMYGPPTGGSGQPGASAPQNPSDSADTQKEGNPDE